MTAASSEQQDRNDMARLVAGHDAALDDLMQRYGERLFHYLLRLLQNETQAHDLAEEAFVRVYLNRSKYKAAHLFSTWLYSIATNLARDVQRHRARHPEVSLDHQLDPSGRDFREVFPEDRPNPAETLEKDERAEAVRIAVGSLPDELREPLVLSVYEEKSHAEIGQILDCSAKAVEMRLYRARQELRVRLEKTFALDR